MKYTISSCMRVACSLPNGHDGPCKLCPKKKALVDETFRIASEVTEELRKKNAQKFADYLSRDT